MVACVEQSTWSLMGDDDILTFTCTDADDSQSVFKVPAVPERGLATDEEKLALSKDFDDSEYDKLQKSANDLLKQARLQMEMAELLMAKNQEQKKDLVQDQQVVPDEGNTRGKIKFRLTQDQLQQIYRKSQERQRIASLQQDQLGEKQGVIDDGMRVDFQKDDLSEDEFTHRPVDMDEELQRIQRRWRNELIEDKLRFKRARMEEDPDPNNNMRRQTSEGKLETIDERGIIPDQDNSQEKRVKLRQHLLMKHENGWEKTVFSREPLRENEELGRQVLHVVSRVGNFRIFVVVVVVFCFLFL